MKTRIPTIASSDITPEAVYLNRRRFMQAGIGAAAAAGLPSIALSQQSESLVFSPVKPSSDNGFYTSEAPASFADATNYNNFYEFGTAKTDPARYADRFNPAPWTLEIDGLCAKPGRFALEDVIAKNPLEERIYRLRCVEAWSMVIPWVGFPLAELIKQAEPLSDARYVSFETVYRPKELPGQRSFGSNIDWPYIEALRLDEAMNSLTFLAVGMYGKNLANQNGAPIRLLVPWKYGFKSIKSIVKISFTKTQPKTTWNILAPQEYGFYANVNPEVDHPRWSQATERRLPSSLWSPNRMATQMFNGYGDQVAHLYKGMNLRRNY